MITIYRRLNDRVQGFPFQATEEIPSDTLWVDIQGGTEISEQEIVARQLRVEIPSQNEIWKNHVLNRLYTENGVAYMTAAIINKKTESPYPVTSAVTFILTKKCLLTVREVAPTSFHNFAQRVQRPSDNFLTAARVLEGLLEEIITRVAYNSEMVVDSLDTLSHDLFNTDVKEGKTKSPSLMMKESLKTLGSSADLNSKINESLHSLNRMLHFFKQAVPTENPLDKNIDADIEILINDTMTLTQQTAFLSDKITFQLDATLGMINVEQNLIIKIFSVVAVFFMPPTLVSSMYGMNFKYMPELEWMYGYPAAIGLMLMCAFIPYLYFRKKGWM